MESELGSLVWHTVLVELKEPWSLQTTCAGLRCSIALRQTTYDILLPVDPTGETLHGFDIRPLTQPPLRVKPRDLTPPVSWGEVSPDYIALRASTRQGPVLSHGPFLRVETIAIEFQARPEADLRSAQARFHSLSNVLGPDDPGGHVYEWILRATNWLDARAGGLQHYGISHRQERRVSGVHINTTEGHSSSRGGSFGYINSSSPGSPEVLMDALSRASRSEAVPISHRLLTSSFKSEPRIAVIEAASAAEAALSAFVGRKLTSEGLPTEAIERIIRQCHGLSGLVGLARELGVPLSVTPDKVAKKLGAIRNRAAHRGDEPSITALSDARAVAARLVQEADPLPTCA